MKYTILVRLETPFAKVTDKVIKKIETNNLGDFRKTFDDEISRLSQSRDSESITGHIRDNDYLYPRNHYFVIQLSGTENYFSGSILESSNFQN